MQNNYGDIVKFHRKQAKLNQKELADLAGVGKTVIFDIENNKVTVRLETLLKVCKALNINLEMQSPLIENFYLGEG